MVEYYDFAQDPSLMTYFNEKIQILLSSMKTRELLKQKNKNPSKASKYQEYDTVVTLCYSVDTEPSPLFWPFDTFLLRPNTLYGNFGRYF